MAGALSNHFVGPESERRERLQELLDLYSGGCAGAVPEGFWRDGFGVLTRCGFRRGWEGRSARQLEDIDPTLELEWLALLRAIEEADDAFCMIELGAGYGPWLMRAAVIRRRLKPASKIDLVAVEGEPTHVDFLRQHAEDNAVPAAALTLLEGAVSGSSGRVRFELANDPSGDWGTRVADASEHPDLPRVPNPRTVEAQAYSLAEVVSERPRVDFLHIDIQGSEVEVLAAAEELLAQRVKRMLVGTHGRAIDGALLGRLPSLGFVLMAEQPCLYRLGGGQPVVIADGAQYCVNSRL